MKVTVFGLSDITLITICDNSKDVLNIDMNVIIISYVWQLIEVVPLRRWSNIGDFTLSLDSTPHLNATKSGFLRKM
jgi:hypothetical protein